MKLKPNRFLAPVLGMLVLAATVTVVGLINTGAFDVQAEPTDKSRRLSDSQPDQYSSFSNAWIQKKVQPSGVLRMKNSAAAPAHWMSAA